MFWFRSLSAVYVATGRLCTNWNCYIVPQFSALSGTKQQSNKRWNAMCRLTRCGAWVHFLPSCPSVLRRLKWFTWPWVACALLHTTEFTTHGHHRKDLHLEGSSLGTLGLFGQYSSWPYELNNNHNWTNISVRKLKTTTRLAKSSRSWVYSHDMGLGTCW